MQARVVKRCRGDVAGHQDFEILGSGDMSHKWTSQAFCVAVLTFSAALKSSHNWRSMSLF